MVFSSISFLFLFLPLFLIFYVSFRAGNIVYLIFSVMFYFIGEGWYVLLIIFSAIMNYAFGLMIDKAGYQWRRTSLVALGVSFNLALLIVFKYAGFLAGAIDPGMRADWASLVHLPLGISFFTFHSISYLVDVYRKDAKAERSFINLALYIFMFPQLIAGPILRYHVICDQLKAREIKGRNVYFGLYLFALGLGQKVLIADTLAGICDPLFMHWQTLSTATAWLSAICYTLQIYFDFNGYSNMAIGLGWMTGFSFPRNFNFPYRSTSITEFWRRWHISLSTWFRDYLYIPLGGNRHGPWRTYGNLIVVFLLCGLWHGASWTFILWGAYHGAFLVAERLGLGDILKKRALPLRHLYAMLVVIFSWVLFRSDTLEQAGAIMRLMVLPTPTHDADVLYRLSGEEIMVLACAVLFSTPLVPTLLRRVAAVPTIERWPERLPLWAYGVGSALAMPVFLAAIIKIFSGSYSPFIYFRF